MVPGNAGIELLAPGASSRPRDRFVEANRLRLHLLDWSDAAAAGDPIVLLHGLQEHAHAFDLVAPLLAELGRPVFALDWRGHGESEWVGRGGYYHFANYVADLGFVVRALGGRAALVAHSMGGNAALLYAGAEPERVSALVSIEGLGPPNAEFSSAPGRFAGWIADLERAGARAARTLTLEQATERLGERFPLWPPEVARHMALHGTRPIGEDDSRAWRFDPLHTTKSPQPFYVEQARAFWQRIACPVLYVDGTRSFIGAVPIETDARLREIGAERVTIEGAGHHPHLEQPGETARILKAFLARVANS